MSKQSGKPLGAFLAGAIIGGLIGVALALLLAPKSGRRLTAGEAPDTLTFARSPQHTTAVVNGQHDPSPAESLPRIVLDHGDRDGADAGYDV